MESELRESLLSLSAAYQAATGLSAATVGSRVAGDSKFFRRLRDGAGFEVSTYDRAVEWFRENWPRNAPWPPGKHGPLRRRGKGSRTQAAQ